MMLKQEGKSYNFLFAQRTSLPNWRRSAHPSPN